MSTKLCRLNALRVFLALNIIVATAMAQQPAPSPTGSTEVDQNGNPLPVRDATAERVLVTGSNLPTANEVGPNPVATYNRETLNKAGERNTEQFLRNLPIANAN